MAREPYLNRVIHVKFIADVNLCFLQLAYSFHTEQLANGMKMKLFFAIEILLLKKTNPDPNNSRR